MARILLVAIVAFVALGVPQSPLRAQFGSIFNSPPPRPPADVPGRQSPDQRFDQPPAEPIPAPMNLPPSQRPGAIEMQPLAPPPGTSPPPSSAPPPAASPLRGTTQPLPQEAKPTPQPPQTLPGLPPGQRQPRGTSQPTEATAPQPGDEIVTEPSDQRIANPTAVFSGLDKITGRTISFDVAINETVQFGALQVTPRACYSRPPTEAPRTDAFVAVDEVTLQGEVRRIFTGWMFAASPGLHAVEHPIYDVWLTDCKGATPAVTANAPAEQPKALPASASQAQKPKPQPSGQPAQKRTTTRTPAPNFLQPAR